MPDPNREAVLREALWAIIDAHHDENDSEHERLDRVISDAHVMLTTTPLPPQTAPGEGAVREAARTLVKMWNPNNYDFEEMNTAVEALGDALLAAPAAPSEPVAPKPIGYIDAAELEFLTEKGSYRQAVVRCWEGDNTVAVYAAGPPVGAPAEGVLQRACGYLINAATEVKRISDQKHDAWDRLGQALERARDALASAPAQAADGGPGA